ncbi:papilin-like [Rhipicephalus sanguineus]|uniref:papilin-like n=1 Tax=Rhipicephalus sanguineus TaxID=34632 RepID=UPI0020C4A348|nr:papilin-like [Rhipicephalus sanguineus]
MRTLGGFLALLVSATCIHGTFSILGMKKPELKLPDYCSKPPFFGGCQPITKEWYFDTTEKICRPTGAGLCCAGHNRFVTRDKCREMCDRRQKLLSGKVTHPNVCVTTPKFVSCGQRQSAWYFDSATRKCKMFSFNANTCGVSGNIFLSELKCQYACMPKMTPTPICSANPAMEGCFIRRKHWYFNFTTNDCMRFPNNHCGKGANSFSSVEKCMLSCSYNRLKVPHSKGNGTSQNELPGSPTAPFPNYRPHPPLIPTGPSTPHALPIQPTPPGHPNEIGLPGAPGLNGGPGPALPPNMPGRPGMPGVPSSVRPASPGIAPIPGLPGQPSHPGATPPSGLPMGPGLHSPPPFQTEGRPTPPSFLAAGSAGSRVSGPPIPHMPPLQPGLSQGRPK